MARHTARMAKDARKALAAEARRMGPHPGDDSKLVCRTYVGARLEKVNGVMTFIPGKRTTYVELRADLENPGGNPKGAMPRKVRGTHLQPVPNQKPVVTKRPSMRTPGWAGVVAASPGDHVGTLATRSTEIHPPVIRSYVGKSDKGASARTANRLTSNVQTNWDRHQAPYKGALRP